MNQNPDRARVSLSVDPHGETESPSLSGAPPFCVLVLGDFSGRGHAPGTEARPLAERRPVLVRSVEELLERLRPTLDFELEGPGRVRIDVRELEDLHPDRLAKRLPHLRGLIEAIEPAVSGHRLPPGPLGPGPAGAEASPAPAEAEESTSRAVPGKGLLDDIVASTRETERPLAGTLPELEPWIRSVVTPHLVREETAGQEALRDRLEREAAEQVVRVLRAPSVREFEGLLRSLLLLLSTADPSVGVRVHVLDVTRSELEADFGRDDLEQSALLRVLLEPLPGPCAAAAPALLVGAYEFGHGVRDVALLNRIAMLAHVLGAPWLSAAGPGLLGAATFHDLAEPDAELDDVTAVWDAFRGTPAASSVGLAAPPFLARMPYGPATDPCELEALDEAAPLRESGSAPATDPYVWGNPAFMCAAALAGSFAEHAWGLRAGGPAEFGGRPIHALAEGDVAAHPTAAVWTASAVERVIGRGVMPLLSFRGEARVRIPWIGSVAEPRGPLEAWWRGP